MWRSPKRHNGQSAYAYQPTKYHRSQDQLPEFHAGFYETINKFLVQENFKHAQFSQEHLKAKYKKKKYDTLVAI